MVVEDSSWWLESKGRAVNYGMVQEMIRFTLPRCLTLTGNPFVLKSGRSCCVCQASYGWPISQRSLLGEAVSGLIAKSRKDET